MTVRQHIDRYAIDFSRRVFWPVQWVVAIALMLFSAVALAASAPLVLSDGTVKYLTAGHLELLEDASGSLTLADVRNAASAGRFQLITQPTPSIGFTSSSFWFRIKLENHAATLKDWLLEILYSPLAYADVYLLSYSGSYQHATLCRRGDWRLVVLRGTETLWQCASLIDPGRCWWLQ